MGNQINMRKLVNGKVSLQHLKRQRIMSFHRPISLLELL